MRTTERRGPRMRRLRLRYLIVPGTALLLCRAFFYQTCTVTSASMRHTLEPGDVVLVDRAVYGLQLPLAGTGFSARRSPAPDDLLIFSYPDRPERTLVKRCVACGGQSVSVRDRILYVDGHPHPLPETGMPAAGDTLPAYRDARDNFGPVRVPPDEYFCMGDNRGNSLDSRYRGTVPRRNVHGRAVAVIFSWNKDAPPWNLRRCIRWARTGRKLY